MKARLRWWLTTADRSDEGTPVSRRIVLASQSALGQFQVRYSTRDFVFGRPLAHCRSVRILEKRILACNHTYLM
jgi:hypothetical protein